MKVALVICNDMHMDLDNANKIINCIMQDPENAIVCDYTIADTIIILTCAFGPGKMKSVRIIADVCLNSKKDARIIVTGCLVKIESEELKRISRIEVITLDKLLKSFKEVSKMQNLVPQNKVVISTGCLHKCSYCVYPQIVEKYKSRTIEDILSEVECLNQTESTICITGAQETSDYGVDLYGSRKFATLMQKIVTNFPDNKYVIGWFHPAGLTDEAMEVICQNHNIAEIMLHIQHVSKEILKNMNRTQFDVVERKIKMLKEKRPDLVISTEVIVGFPGETTEQFKELVEVLDKGYFSDIGVASYEPVYGTKAAELPLQIPDDTKNERMEFIKNRYSATCYPADNNSSNSIIDEYIRSINILRKLPKNILLSDCRQKYNLIAGTDIEQKFQFCFQFNYVFMCISNARSEFDMKVARKKIEIYTDETRKMFFEIIDKGNFKNALKDRAKYLLLK